MKCTDAQDDRAASLRLEISDEAVDTGTDALKTANLFLWDVQEIDSPLGPRADWLTPSLQHIREAYGVPIDANTGPSPWASFRDDALTAYMLRLLVHGESLEPPAFGGRPDAAHGFVTRLLDWLGAPLLGLCNRQPQATGVTVGFPLVALPHWSDTGFILLGPARAGFLLFLGTD